MNIERRKHSYPLVRTPMNLHIKINIGTFMNRTTKITDGEVVLMSKLVTGDGWTPETIRKYCDMINQQFE